MERLFTYGTLQQSGVQLATFGRLLAGEADALPGYAIEMLTITDPEVIETSGSDQHPILRATGNESDQVAGTAYVITAAELAAADEYEVDDYARIAVTLASGRTAWVYAPSGS